MTRGLILLLMIIFTATSILSFLLFDKFRVLGNRDSARSEVRDEKLSADRQKPPQTTIILGGDVMLGRNVMSTSLDNGDYSYPFRNIASFLQSADIVFVNLENPIIKNCPRHDGGFTFCASEGMVEGLVFSGVDIVNLANNHSLNYGREGLTHTVDVLGSHGITSTGVNGVELIEGGGVVFSFLGFDKSQQTTPQLTTAEWLLVEEAQIISDILIVAMHWGTEYQDTGLPGVKRLGAQLIERGVDIVVGHHPHWVQDLECFAERGVESESGKWEMIKPITKQEVVRGVTCPTGSKPVYYSLGNLIFDQMWSEETKKGLLVKLDFEGKELVFAQHFNTYMSFWAQPEIVE